MNTHGDSPRPRILFVCNTNGGKSQMAAALLRQRAGDALQVESAGLVPAGQINRLAAEVLAENGADMRSEVPSALSEARLRAADRVIIVGGAQVPELEGVAMERWVPRTAPESLANDRERMEFLRSDLETRVVQLEHDIAGGQS
ncbi:MAG: low molecular weight phosphatase family protein [Micrococcaceae bacterium]|nr:low molecular weight phosphatase family protein [Micrococcaceae bacterium]